MKYHLKKFNERITLRRESLCLTQSELAKKTGITRAAMCLLEKGTRVPQLSTLCHLAEGLNTSVGFLLGEEEPKINDSDFNENYSKLSKKDKDFIKRLVKLLVFS